MTSIELKKLLKLSRKEKIRIVHTLWDDIARTNDKETLSREHREILEKRLKKIENGKTKFKSWNEVKKKYSDV